MFGIFFHESDSGLEGKRLAKSRLHCNRVCVFETFQACKLTEQAAKMVFAQYTWVMGLAIVAGMLPALSL